MNRIEVIEQTKFWSDELANKLSIPVVNIAVEFSNRMTHTAGKAYSGRSNKIRYSASLIEQEKYNFEPTIAHEVAHIYATAYYGGKQGHNHNWQRIMRMTGFPVTRCHTYETPKRKGRASTITLPCMLCGEEYRVGKKVQDKIKFGYARYSCTKCNTVITPEYLNSFIGA